MLARLGQATCSTRGDSVPSTALEGTSPEPTVPQSKTRTDLRRLERLVDQFRGVRLLVLGDLVLDEYIWGDVDRISPEAPVPVVHVRDETMMLGGAANAARNVVALGGAVDCCSVIGDDAAGQRVVTLLKDLGVDPGGLVHDPERPTTRKTRVIAGQQQVVRFDREIAAAPPPRIARELLGRLARLVGRADGAIIEDYGKGVLSRRLAAAAMKRFAEAGVPVAVDPKADLSPYRGAALVKPNFREAELLAGMQIRDPASLARAAVRLRRRVGGGALVITRGADGMSLFEDDGPGVHVATASRAVFDVQGAGDTSIAALMLALRAGGSLYEAAIVANAASGIVVNKVGTATASADEVKAALPAALAAARSAR
jgi:D-beta-D-heptose 7-phosphate kinase/D-beta-D-heptose 1-phosphate adenosyltransferase